MKINRRNFLKGAAASTFALPLSSYAGANESKQDKPNIILLFADDFGWKDTGFMGSDFYETPNLDKLASQGMHFTNAYANAANCAPTRACMMSGQYSPRHGVYTVSSPARGNSSQRKLIPTENTTYLDTKFITMGEAMKAGGYATCHGGKWHLGSGEETGPEAQGFDVNIGGFKAGSPPGGYFAPWKKEAPNIQDAEKGEHICDHITGKILNFIEEKKDVPFFAYLAFYDVHTPIQAKPELIEKYTKKLAKLESEGTKTLHSNTKYAAMVETMDTNVGRVMKKLDGLGIADNTVVVFCSDNGGYGGATNMRPLRGCKGMYYEGGIREPLVVRWPDKIKAGSKCDTPVITTDFYPTFLDITSTPAPKNYILDGESILPLLKGGTELKREAIFWHFPAYLQGPNSFFLKDTHDPPHWRSTPCGVVRKGDWKLIEYFEDGDLELYNLKNDISERNNLSKKHPDKVKELHDLMKKWRKETNAPVPTERNPEYGKEAGPAGKKRKIKKKN